jgi:hypothetical protein
MEFLSDNKLYLRNVEKWNNMKMESLLYDN